MTALSRCALAALVSALPLVADDGACKIDTPCYSTASVVNSGSYTTGWLAPNTFASIFGLNLAHGTVNGLAGPQDRTGQLGGVRVLVNSQPTFISYVSPNQVNFVVPVTATGDTVTVQLVRESLAGPAVTLTMHDSAPALFQQDATTAAAAHLDRNWAPVTQQSPAHAGEWIALYATGLGPYKMSLLDFYVPIVVDPIARLAEFQLLLNGQAVDPKLIPYVGAAIAIGVFQINLQLPAWVGPNPEIRIALGDRISPPGLSLPVQ